MRSLNAGSTDGLTGYRIGFTIAFILGMLATSFYARIPEPPARRTARPQQRIRHVAGIMRRNPGFAWLAVSSTVWGFAVNAAGPFFSVYLVEDLGGNAAIVGVGAAVAAVTGLAGFLVFGRMADRRGSRAVVILTGLVLPFLPSLWIFARAAWNVWLVNIPSGFIWAGYNLASYNLLLEMSPAEDREAGVAVFQTFVAISAIVGPIFGGWLAGKVGYVAMFSITGFGRLAATLLLIALARPKPRAALAAAGKA